MFNIGGGELVVIALVALIVLGPQRLPDAARQAGKVLADLRRLSTGFQDEMRGAFTDTEPDTLATSRRDAFGSARAADSAVTTAVASVSGQRPKRRAPLRAVPTVEEPRSEAANKTAKQVEKTIAKKAPRRSAPPPSPRPRAGGG